MIRLCFVLIVAVCINITSVGITFAEDKPTTGGTLRGQVTDTSAVQNPLEGVEVKIIGRSGKEWTAKTDVNGNYECSGIPTDRYLISAFKEGYQGPPRKPMTILNGGDYFVPLKMAEKGNVEQLLAVRPAGIDAIIRQVRSLIQRVAESVGERYDLNEAGVRALHRSVLDSVERTPGRVSGLGASLKALGKGNTALLEVLLSHPACKAALAKHLSEAQLQDYLDFTAARWQRDQQAIARRITVALDKALSLTADQREKVVQSLLDTTENEAFPNSIGTLGIGSQEAANLVYHRLKISLDGVLGDAQSKLWQGLVDKVDAEKRPMFIRKKAVEIDKVDEEVADVRKRSIRIGDNTTESEERMKWIAEAKLTAHTELLGPLDERAARRLALAAKGTVQQDFEFEEEAHEQMLRELEARFMKEVEAGKMTREQAAVRLQVMRKDLWKEEDINKRHETSASDITNHSLYQQAIKDVLSEEAFNRYKAHQAEREALRLQALRDITVACMDTQLLLSDSQREQLETAVSHLAPVPYAGSKPAEFMFFQLFRRARNFEILTLWQQGEFERVFTPLAF
ncbi:MAG: carboxypeptidase-like regulatory domain-containing protein [Candidatus Poribacteria bacterium]|nr:carboxypeptidase-like regulatory domain-containing protein [Candidatus Poribacteria bacterium]